MDASGLSKTLWFDFFTDFRDVFGSWSRISDFDPVYPILFRCQKCVDRSRRSPARNIADVFQTTPRPRFGNRERRIESRAFHARRDGDGRPSLRTGRVIGSRSEPVKETTRALSRALDHATVDSGPLTNRRRNRGRRSGFRSVREVLAICCP